MKNIGNMLRSVAAIALTVFVSCTTSAKVHVSEINFHNEATDTTRITEILKEASVIANPNERVMFIAEKFVGTPYVAHTLESDDLKERLTVNLDELDCTTFVETVFALAKTAGEHRTSWRDFVANLEEIRYRGGTLKDYPSRLHYISDWIVDNTHRGNVVEVSGQMPGYRTMEKTIDFMSRNASRYPALADSTTLAEIKGFEMGYRKHRYPYIPWNAVNNKGVKEKMIPGDMVAMLTKVNGLDVTHLGLLIKDEKGTPYLLHASLKGGKVEKSTLPLQEYLRKNDMPGIRLVRLKD